MTEARARYRSDIIDLIGTTEHRICEMDAPIDSGQSEPMDRVQAEAMRRVDDVRCRFYLRRLDELRKTLARLDSGEYGSCENCRRQIEPERLKVLPETTLCLACAEEEP